MEVVPGGSGSNLRLMAGALCLLDRTGFGRPLRPVRRHALFPSPSPKPGMPGDPTLDWRPLDSGHMSRPAATLIIHGGGRPTCLSRRAVSEADAPPTFVRRGVVRIAPCSVQ